jgi:hypothetical protein
MSLRRILILGLASLFIAAPAAAQTLVPFVIEDGMVTPEEDFVVKAEILGAALVWQPDGYDCPVAVRMTIAGTAYDLFGRYSKALEGNVNDHQNPRRWYFPQRFDGSVTSIGVEAKAWERKAGRTGSSESDWKIYLEEESWGGTDRVIVLRNGDPVPAVPGFEDQKSVAEFVDDYVDTSTTPYTMKLSDNQVIYLFEIGTRPVGHPYCDYQDVVVLITLGDSLVELDAAGFAAD